MAAPKSYPGDEYIKSLIAAQGYIKPDINRNTIIGINVTIDGKSVGNYIVAENARVTNSHNNILNAKNVVIENASGCRADGADHTIKWGANYSSVDGDANWIEGYASRTSGFGNTNCCEYGMIDGQNNRIGIRGQANKYNNSSIRGNKNEIDGNNCHIIGNFIRVMGNDIIAFGNGDGVSIITEPGVYRVNNEMAIKL